MDEHRFEMKGRKAPRLATTIRRTRSLVSFGLGIAATLVGLAVAGSAQAQTSSVTPGILYVGNDRGGVVSQRAREIQQIRAKGQQVVISGDICFSTCTMYLGLSETCVYPRTRFRFHGPSFYGKALSSRDFEYWSQVIASHYPAPLQSWYLAEGRSRISSYYQISGAEIIRLGVRQCTAGQTGAGS